METSWGHTRVNGTAGYRREIRSQAKVIHRGSDRSELLAKVTIRSQAERREVQEQADLVIG